MQPNGQLSPAYLAEDASAPLMATCIAFLAIEATFMVLLYTARYLPGEQKANLSMTLLMTGAYLVCVSKITIGILSIKIGGAGRHLMSLTPTTITTALKLNTALQIVCPLTTSLSKLSILCLLHTILSRTCPRTRIAIKGTFILVLAILLVQVVIPFANCKPFSKNWEVMGPGSCAIQPLSLWRYLSIPNVVTTIIIVGIPLPALYKLNVSPATKVGLGLVFSVCIAGIVAAIMRFQSFLEVANFNDITYENIKPLCWTIAESGIYLVAGVLPTLRPLVRKVFGDVPFFDRILSGSFKASRSSASWGNKRWSRMVVKWDKPLPPPKAPEVYSDMSSKGTLQTVEEDEKRWGVGSTV